MFGNYRYILNIMLQLYIEKTLFTTCKFFTSGDIIWEWLEWLITDQLNNLYYVIEGIMYSINPTFLSRLGDE